MAWLVEKADRRADPRALWPEVRSAVMLGMNYGPGADPLAALAERSRGAISVYAQGLDYHDVVKSKLKAVARDFARASGADVKVFVDTAPVMEKPLAQAAGIGWQGKHTNLVSRAAGSWLFLGAIFTTAALQPDTPERNRCGSCRRCLDICPTRAFPAPYRIDARRCISYLTIEHKGRSPTNSAAPWATASMAATIAWRVCPWNKFAQAAREAKFAALPGAANPPLAELLALDDAAFRARFRGSPIKRIGRDRFVRNVLVAAGNSGETAILAAVAPLLADPSPPVRGMAVWAVRRLANAGTGRSAESEALCGRTRCGRACGMGLRLMKHLFVFGLGYSASAIAALLRRSGWQVSGTARSPAKFGALAAQGFAPCCSAMRTASGGRCESATHCLVSVPPREAATRCSRLWPSAARRTQASLGGLSLHHRRLRRSGRRLGR